MENLRSQRMKQLPVGRGQYNISERKSFQMYILFLAMQKPHPRMIQLLLMILFQEEKGLKVHLNHLLQTARRTLKFKEGRESRVRRNISRRNERLQYQKSLFQLKKWFGLLQCTRSGTR